MATGCQTATGSNFRNSFRRIRVLTWRRSLSCSSCPPRRKWSSILCANMLESERIALRPSFVVARRVEQVPGREDGRSKGETSVAAKNLRTHQARGRHQWM